MSPIFEIPIPVMLRQPEFGVLSENVLQAAVRAAYFLGTMFFINPEYYSANLAQFADCLVPCLSKHNYLDFLERAPGIRMMELSYDNETGKIISGLRALKTGLIISAGVPLDSEAASKAVELAECGADTIHFYADSRGRELDSENPRFIKEMIREVHLRLVGKLIRNRVNLVFSGGIAMAEHVAKAIICGADGVTIDIPLLIALECRLCYRCRDGKACPVKIGDINPDWGKQRIINLIGAWRNQLIEVMGAMGIREARRLRGEIGRSMWFEDLERENFGPIFGEKKVSGLV
jgi:imidazole glycerol phosphate synthase subunit HisF